MSSYIIAGSADSTDTAYVLTILIKVRRNCQENQSQIQKY
jgi:hypothetical protein